jgi:hypothetical protein
MGTVRKGEMKKRITVVAKETRRAAFSVVPGSYSSVTGGAPAEETRAKGPENQTAR